MSRIPRRRLAAVLLVAVLAAAACSDIRPRDRAERDGEPSAHDTPGADVAHDDTDPGDAPPDEDATAPIATRVRMDFTRAEGFWSAPFPDLSLQRSDGRVDLSAFPRPGSNAIVAALLELAAERDGFGTTSTLFFTATGALDPESLPDVHASVGAEAAVQLVAVDSGARHPVEVRYHEQNGRFGARHMLSILPLQGLPLRPATRYAAVVTTAVRDADGEPLAAAPELAVLRSGETPDGLDDATALAYREALEALEARAGLSSTQIAGLAVFDTGQPALELARVVEAMRAAPLPEVAQPFEAGEQVDDFCVYQSTLELPVYQRGEPPFDSDGGWVFDATGAPVLQGSETARIVVTLPRAAMPPGGFPLVVFVRTGGGGDRPLVDRGVRGADGEVLEAGTGLAREFAREGFAGVSIDGPHGGLRNVTGGDEQFLMFNVVNPLALRDNVRQSAAELALLVDVLATLTVDATGCPGLASDAVRFDLDHLALFGHSMGATIAPLVLAVEPRYGATILSGAGGSWIENIIHKQSPLEVRPAAELLLGYSRNTLHEHDPALALFQWAIEPADPPVYARTLVHEPPDGEPPRHVLMLQGIVDTYILPPIANATSLAFGLDLGGEALDADHEGLAAFEPFVELAPLAGRAALPLPVSGNAADGRATAVVVQHLEDGVEDGHEVVFQLEAPKRQLRCLLRSWRDGGVPVVCP